MYYRLMDAVDPAIVGQVETVAAASPRVVAVTAPRVRWHGHRLVADLDITVPGELPVSDGHSIAEDVRHRLLHAVAHLDDAHVHVDPDDAHAHDGAGHHHG
jgi:divalent metal cation (Fe/Co/Zn/Cd) transporter